MLSEARKGQLRELLHAYRMFSSQVQSDDERLRHVYALVSDWIDAARSEGAGLDLADVERLARFAANGRLRFRLASGTNYWECSSCGEVHGRRDRIQHAGHCLRLAGERVIAALEQKTGVRS